MSHYTVTLVIEGASTEEEARDKIESMMAPFQENNMGDCPKEYLEFHDQEDDFLEQYNTKGTERVVLADGTIDDFPFSEKYHSAMYTAALKNDPIRLRIETLAIEKSGQAKTYPEGSEIREIPFTEIYPTFEEFVSDYEGKESRDEEKGRYGYWENPEARWDWYQVGGRWSGLLRTTEGQEVDVAQKKNLDFGWADTQAREKCLEFWREFQEIVATGVVAREQAMEYTPFYGVRSTAYELGLVTVKSSKEITEEEKTHARHWSEFEGRRGDDLWDIYHMTDLTEETALDRFYSFFYPFRTYALLDSDGWQEPGKMGWFGCSHSEADDKTSYSEKVVNKLQRLPEDVWLAVVDCHI